MVQGSWFRVQGSSFRVQDSGFMVQVQGLGWGLAGMVEDLRLKVQG